MKRAWALGAVFLFVGMCLAPASGKDPAEQDSRLGRAKDYNGYFPWTPPTDKKAWETRRQELREQVLVATGLWPMPEKAPLGPVIHGKIDRDSYTIEKVFFASYPGHYVSGNLYRPKGKTGKLPGVLCPHGHWHNGRFYEQTDQGALDQVKQGAEKTIEGAHYPLQARCAMLARMGCVVFHYDMVGVADSQQIGHRAGFTDADAELRLQSFLGLQTFNNIRALDFLLNLAEVDPQRIGVTGASGGGTQTFILCAVDDRPAAAFPAVMVSTAMQGGCICENCSYLRIGTGNIELAGIFAPKPLAMSGAHDWTIDIETRGLPELKALYKLYGAEDRVLARCFPQFEHNYNQVSREVMYNWFNKHLLLDQPEPVVEKPFVPVPPAELSVFDAQHPRPREAVGVRGLRKTITRISDQQLAGSYPDNPQNLGEFRRIVGTALRAMITDKLPQPADVEAKSLGVDNKGSARGEQLVLGRKGQGEHVPALLVSPAEPNGKVVVWIHPAGKASLFDQDKLTAAAQKIVDKKCSILAPDVFHTGDLGATAPIEINGAYAGYTFGYNRPVLANRVHDILTAVGYAKGLKNKGAVHLTGWGRAGPWVLLARGLCGDAVVRTAVDPDHFRFRQVHTCRDEMMLPGALKYGDLPAFAALCAPATLYLHNVQDSDLLTFAVDAYQAAGALGNLHHQEERASPEAVVDWLLHQ